MAVVAAAIGTASAPRPVETAVGVVATIEVAATSVAAATSVVAIAAVVATLATLSDQTPLQRPPAAIFKKNQIKQSWPLGKRAKAEMQQRR